MKLAILLLLVSIMSFANSVDFKSHFFANGKEIEGMDHIMIMPNTPTLIEVYFSDPRTNEVYKEFKVMHGKYMHMIVSNKDLSVFKHIHPYFDPITGRFSITLNLPYADPDNQDTSSALVKPGMYMIMTDVIVKGVGMRMDHAMAMVKGQNSQVQLQADFETNGTIEKFFYRDNESIPTYKAIFNKKIINGCSGNIVKFEIEMFKYEGDQYVEMLDFKPWLSEAAHAVWLSEGYMNHMHHNMPFAHMHSPFFMDDDNDDSNDVVKDNVLRFNFHDKKKMLHGLQKMWIQFKHLDKIMKIPFVFLYEPQKPRGC